MPGNEQDFLRGLMGRHVDRLESFAESSSRGRWRTVSVMWGAISCAASAGGWRSRAEAVAKRCSRVTLEEWIHQVFPSTFRPSQKDETYGKVLPLTVSVPAEDDGGGTGLIIILFEKHFGVKVPAMGDVMNISGLSLGELNETGQPRFPYIFNVLRGRFPDDAQDVFSQFLYIAHEQMETAIASGASKEDLARLATLLYAMYGDFREMYRKLEVRGKRCRFP